MKRLLIITQKVDEQDDLLGFFVAWIREFSRLWDSVTVITLGVGVHTLPSNVRILSLGKERGSSKFSRAISFGAHCIREIPRHDVVFAHMSPVFAIAAAPLTKLFQKKLILWYLHRSATIKLKLAIALADKLVTADTQSLTIRNSKIVAVGHGIDVQRFSNPQRVAPANRPIRILSVGRVSPIKGFETLLRAVHVLRKNGFVCEIRIVGAPVMKGDAEYAGSLHALIQNLEISDIVTMIGFVPYADMPKQYAWADVVAGCTPPGGIDKVLLEAMAAGCIVMTSNGVMGAHLTPYADQLVFPAGDSERLAQLLNSLHEYDELSRAMVVAAQRYTVESVVKNISALV
ncbi:MAG: glycosyltransferase family 4 protein [Candidatus Pacebacteria bacterium]|nr:glycosyltransferase family 4 protein [Candidatus Paceibacterota bacterium]